MADEQDERRSFREAFVAIGVVVDRIVNRFEFPVRRHPIAPMDDTGRAADTQITRSAPPSLTSISSMIRSAASPLRTSSVECTWRSTASQTLAGSPAAG